MILLPAVDILDGKAVRLAQGSFDQPTVYDQDPLEAALRELAERIGDRNFRLFAERGRLHAINGSMFLEGTDPFALFAEMHRRGAIDPAHAFYLGYELAKAVTALTLGKNYVQDQALAAWKDAQDWFTKYLKG